MTKNELETFIKNKICTQKDFIVFTYYEIRVKMGMSESEMLSFLHIARHKLKNEGYSIYTTGQVYSLDGKNIVQNNQLMVAIKNRIGR